MAIASYVGTPTPVNPAIAQPIVSPDIYTDISLPPPTLSVYSQYPQAGAVLPVGSTVFVQLIDLNYVSFGQVNTVENPPALDNVSLAQATQIIDSSAELKEAVYNPQVRLSPEKAAELINISSAEVLAAPLELSTQDSLQALTAFRSISYGSRL